MSRHYNLPPREGEREPEGPHPHRLGPTEITIGLGVAALIGLVFAAAVMTENPHVSSPYGRDAEKAQQWDSPQG